MAPRLRARRPQEVIGFLANPLVLILIMASVVSALLRDTVNAAIIALMVVLSVILNFVQAYRWHWPSGSHRSSCP